MSANDFNALPRASRCSSVQGLASARGTPSAWSVRNAFRLTTRRVSAGAPSSMPARLSRRLLVRSRTRSSGSAGKPSRRAIRFDDRFSSRSDARHARSAGSTSIRVKRQPCTHNDARFANRSTRLICANDRKEPPYRDNAVTVSSGTSGSSRRSTLGRSNGSAVASSVCASFRDFAARSRRVCSTWYFSWSAARAARRVGLCRVGMSAPLNARGRGSRACDWRDACVRPAVRSEEKDDRLASFLSTALAFFET